MRKTVLAFCVVLIFISPSLAQEGDVSIDINGLFTLDATIWQYVGRSEMLGFYGGSVYICTDPFRCMQVPNSFYFDFFIFSYFRFDLPAMSFYGTVFPIIGMGNSTVCSVTCERMRIRKMLGPWMPN